MWDSDRGWQDDNIGEGSSKGWTPRRRMTNRVQGGDDGGRSLTEPEG